MDRRAAFLTPDAVRRSLPPAVEGQAGAHYTISAGFDAASHPARLLVTNVPAAFEAWLRERAAALRVEVVTVDSPAALSTPVDDLVLLDPDGRRSKRPAHIWPTSESAP